MALEGSLRDFDLFSLFNMVKTQGKSGTLVLSRGQEFVKIFFDNGEIVGCDSNQVRMEDRVGAMLVRLGRLSGEELLAMIQKQRQTLKRMGVLLLESGKVSAQDLQDALFNQAMSIIYRTFRWVEGDYRFDSILPLDLDRENFPPIPVDTVLMEAARIMDEWPEVMRRLPDGAFPLVKTAKARDIILDLDKELSSVLEGRGGFMGADSGLTHEQETILTYFAEPLSIQGAIHISRYEELDTCKHIADLLEMGLLEVSQEKVEKAVIAWELPPSVEKRAAPAALPSPIFWPCLAVMLALPVLTYVQSSREKFNQGLASFQPADLQSDVDPVTRARQVWALRMASSGDGGVALARTLGLHVERGATDVPEFTRQPDPLALGAPEPSRP